MKGNVFQEDSAETVDMAREDTPTPISPVASQHRSSGWVIFWEKWFPAFKQVFPLIIAVYLTAFVVTCLSLLIAKPDFSPIVPDVSTLWVVWQRWDTGNFLHIVNFGYSNWGLTAFFPLYPLLIRGAMVVVPSPLIAALLISNLAAVVALVVLYQLVREDFDQERAQRVVLYLMFFPTAFFLLAAYNESLFLCLTLLSFYQMRRGQWLLAGLFGFFAALTRSAGLLLLLPFAYEYLRQRAFQWKKIRFSVLSLALIPAGLALFSLYCYWLFHDPLAFSHAQALWQRSFRPPWFGIQRALGHIISGKGLLSYLSLRNAIDLIPDLWGLVLFVLGIVGPWRFRSEHWAYLIYGVALFLFFQLFPELYVDQLLSMARFMLELFPIFIILSALGKYRIVNYSYLMVGSASGAALLLMFLMGRWIV